MESSFRPGQSARAVFDYVARAEDELSFKKHDVILILGKDEEDDGASATRCELPAARLPARPPAAAWTPTEKGTKRADAPLTT